MMDARICSACGSAPSEDFVATRTMTRAVPGNGFLWADPKREALVEPSIHRGVLFST